MPRHICVTCGVQYPDADTQPASCPICLDERQYVGWQGQRWTSLAQMKADGFHNSIREEEPGLYSIGTRPQFAIGQHALLVTTPAGNLLWDCISYLDEETVRHVNELGGVQAIAVSHPHFYASCIEWSEAFGGAPIYLHEADRQWTMFPHPNVMHWTGETEVPFDGVSLIRLGGHFDGAAVAHWPAGAEGKGVILCGDTLMVVMDRRYVSFMYSFPNLIPLGAAKVTAAVTRLAPFSYERIYGAWPGRIVSLDGPRSVERSAERYLRYIGAHDGSQPS